MFDPSKMYPTMYRSYTRTQRPPRYYLIDFGLSRQYESQNSLDICHGSAPEHQIGAQCNPFSTDIYYLGNLVRQEFIQVR